MTREEEIALPFTQEEYDVAVAEISKELRETKEENKRLREALEYYADDSNYPEFETQIGKGINITRHGLGYVTSKRAKQTLEEKE